MIDPRQVSVPSQGKNSVELRRGLALPSPYSSFPSPCREKGSVELETRFLTTRFLSPCGERVLLNVAHARAVATK